MIAADAVERCRDFHGHMCPGLAVGMRAGALAVDRLGPHSKDHELVAIVETDMCAVDGIQVLTGCTFGKGNLIHLDHGKNAFTFVSRSRDIGVRLLSRQSGRSGDDERARVAAMIQHGTATEADHLRFQELQHERAARILEAPLDEVFTVTAVPAVVPGRARVHDTVTCTDCGEPTMETRARPFGGRMLCAPCFERRDHR